jgi:hypothetical protein
LAALSLTGCDVDVNDPGEAPEVNVEGGRAPDVDVIPPDVDVRTEERDVTIPDVDVDVDSERTRVQTPNVDIDVPSENENEPGRP